MELDVVINQIRARAVKIPLKDPFNIAGGGMAEARVLYVTLTLSDGVEGYGEAAPFEAVTGETLSKTGQAIRDLTPLLLNEPILSWQSLAEKLKSTAHEQAAARCALETAMFDAMCRSLGIPMHQYFAPAQIGKLQTDITIPVVDLTRTVELARQWTGKGFNTLKMKVGVDVDAEIQKVLTVSKKHPNVKWILDANGGFDVADAVKFSQALQELKKRIIALEQPVKRGDIEGMVRVKQAGGLEIAADESARTVEDVRVLASAKAVDLINLKIMKSGVTESIAMAKEAKGRGLGLMIGGMIETRLAMGCSLAIAAGLGGFKALDLDTPLLMTQDAWRGGFEYRGAMMVLPTGAGLDGHPGKPIYK